MRQNERGEVIISVAVPVQRFRALTGALLLSTQGGEIETAVETERWVIVRVFLISAAVMVVLSILLARSIGGPLRRLAGAADVVRRRIRSRVEIPDFSKRSDEVGHLSGSLRDMTDALYARIAPALVHAREAVTALWRAGGRDRTRSAARPPRPAGSPRRLRRSP